MTHISYADISETDRRNILSGTCFVCLRRLGHEAAFD